MNRSAVALAFLACAVLTMLPVAPLRADLILTSDDWGRGMAAPADNATPAGSGSAIESPMQVGTLLSGDEWYEIPLGVAFMIGAAVGIYTVVNYYFYEH